MRFPHLGFSWRKWAIRGANGQLLDWELLQLEAVSGIAEKGSNNLARGKGLEKLACAR